MSKRSVSKNAHREDFGAERGLWTPDSYRTAKEPHDPIRGAAHAPHTDGSKLRGLSFSNCVALSEFVRDGKIDDDAATRLRAATAVLTEIASFEALLVERDVAIAANVIRRKGLRAEASSVPSHALDVAVEEPYDAASQGETVPTPASDTP